MLSFYLSQVSTCKVVKQKIDSGDISPEKDLQLLGEDLQLVEVSVDGRVRSNSEFKVSSDTLTVLSTAMPNEVRNLLRNI